MREFRTPPLWQAEPVTAGDHRVDPVRLRPVVIIKPDCGRKLDAGRHFRARRHGRVRHRGARRDGCPRRHRGADRHDCPGGSPAPGGSVEPGGSASPGATPDGSASPGASPDASASPDGGLDINPSLAIVDLAGNVTILTGGTCELTTGAGTAGRGGRGVRDRFAGHRLPAIRGTGRRVAADDDDLPAGAGARSAARAKRLAESGPGRDRGAGSGIAALRCPFVVCRQSARCPVTRRRRTQQLWRGRFCRTGLAGSSSSIRARAR